MKCTALFDLIRCTFAFLVVSNVIAQQSNSPASFHYRPLNPDDPKGIQLGPGVPRTVDTNGNVIGIDQQFSTDLYQSAAIHLLLNEASQVALKLSLSEQIPLTESNLTEATIAPFGYSYVHKTIGTVCTRNYHYNFSIDDKFNEVGVVNYTQTCTHLSSYTMPKVQLDTNSAYRLATQWLAAVSMDVKALSRDCRTHVAVTPEWSGLNRLGEEPKRRFVPIYFVWWTSSRNDTEKLGDTAFVELYLPEERLIQLGVRDPQYILKEPAAFTNLSSLFPGVGRISIITNFPTHKIVTSEPRY